MNAVPSVFLMLLTLSLLWRTRGLLQHGQDFLNLRTRITASPVQGLQQFCHRHHNKRDRTRLSMPRTCSLDVLIRSQGQWVSACHVGSKDGGDAADNPAPLLAPRYYRLRSDCSLLPVFTDRRLRLETVLYR